MSARALGSGVRVLEVPTCRWSTLQCRAAGVDPFDADCATQAAEQTARAQERGAQGDVYGKCCLRAEDEPFYATVIRERAWTSPIWYDPAPRGPAQLAREPSPLSGKGG